MNTTLVFAAALVGICLGVLVLMGVAAFIVGVLEALHLNDDRPILYRYLDWCADMGHRIFGEENA
jgi:hypothetical protein